MSVVLNGSGQYLRAYFGTEGPFYQNYPFSISLWFKTSNITSAQGLGFIGSSTWDTNSSHSYNYLYTRGADAGDPVSATVKNGLTTERIDTTTGFSANTWYHVLGVFNSDTDRRVYINGSSKATGSTNINGARDTQYVGIGRVSSITTEDFTGKIAEVAVWSSALSDANAVSLAGGALATEVDAANLESYWPLYDDPNSDAGNTSTNFTEYGSPSYDTNDSPLGESGVEASGSISLTLSMTGTAAAKIEAAGSASMTLTLTGYAAATLKGTSFSSVLLVAVGNNRLYYESA
jgi:hypothetical protein